MAHDLPLDRPRSPQKASPTAVALATSAGAKNWTIQRPWPFSQYLAVSEAGGVMKTTLLHLVEMRLRRAGLAPRMTVYDNAPRLQFIYQNRAKVDVHASTADSAAAMSDPGALFDHFAPLSRLLRSDSPAVIELGALVVKNALQFFEMSQIADLIQGGRRLVVFVCTTEAGSAVATSVGLFKRLRATLPSAHLVVAVRMGPGGKSHGALGELPNLVANDGNSRLVRIEHWTSRAFALYDRLTVPLDQLADAPLDKFAEDLGDDPAIARFHQLRLRAWLEQTYDALGDLLPPIALGS